LYLEVAPSGGKWWRLKYRHAGKEKRLSLGVYPDVSLKDARQRRDDARKLLANDIDPAENRKAAKAAKVERAGNSFEVIAREWYAKNAPNWAENHGKRILQRFERDLFPWIGGRPIAEITAPELLAVLRRIEARGAVETAHRAHQNCGQVFRYAIATGRAVRDPSPDLKGALPPVKEKHLAAITDPKAIGPLLRAIDDYQGQFVTKCALRLAPLVFVRPGELRNAEWVEFDLDKAEWNIPAERMKMRQPHLVPLSAQAVAILRELHALADVVKHKKAFYNASYANYDACLAGQLRLIPEDAALAALRDDFQRMIGAGMFIGEPPAFDTIVDRLRALGACRT